tara:strand:+ start:292 stop:498 length:207 start_codon:yes stop_codon:yes gene_type:complete
LEAQETFTPVAVVDQELDLQIPTILLHLEELEGEVLEMELVVQLILVVVVVLEVGKPQVMGELVVQEL